MDGFPETQGKILTNSSKFFENSSKILSKLKQNPQKLNLPEIPVTCVAAKTAKKQACYNPYKKDEKCIAKKKHESENSKVCALC